MRVLEPALGRKMEQGSIRDIPMEALEVLSGGGDFDRLTASLFAFAHNLAQRRLKG